MQFKLLALSAFAASVTAQSSTSGIDTASVYAVLATALPSSLVAEALTNSRAVASEIASEFSEGNTPSWFAALPTGIQSYLLGPAASQVANGTGLTNQTIVANGSSTIAIKTTTNAQGHTTLVPAGHTTRTNGGGNTNTATGAGASASGSSSSSSGGASMPTNIIGAGLAGAVGLVGLLAL